MPKIFDPVSDKIIRAIELDRGNIKKIKPGQKPPLGSLAVFKYSPKHHRTLAYFDTFPASVVIGHYSDGFLAVNLHFLPWSFRLNLAERMLRATKNKNRITYAKIKKAFQSLQLPIGYAQIILKRYLFSHITSKEVYIFNFTDYKNFLKDVPGKFQKKSDTTVFKLTIAKFNAHAKKSKKKPKFTNIRRK
jgi:hypothetical protein